MIEWSIAEPTRPIDESSDQTDGDGSSIAVSSHRSACFVRVDPAAAMMGYLAVLFVRPF